MVGGIQSNRAKVEEVEEVEEEGAAAVRGRERETIFDESVSEQLM